ncbi:MAG TPA: response regulator transcription factor [Acidimicrobiia bacterium]|nr:response regulator transcription factor [Acidimicrobiia bacterium]
MTTSPSDRRAQHILIIEDEPGLAESVRYALEAEGFEVTVADNGFAGLDEARRSSPDLVLLDLMLPEMSGLDVCRQIRLSSDVPIIMLTAKDSEADKVTGLELGADDYMTKPFSMRELIARVRAHLRRNARTGLLADSNEVLRGGPVELDIDAHVTRVGGNEVELRPKEFELLESLMRRKNRLAARHTLIDEVWGPSYFGDTKTLDVHIKRLREKLESDSSNPKHIVTVRGLGYKFVDE